MDLLDIRDFTLYTSVTDTDRVLMTKGGRDAAITVGLLRSVLTESVTPSIRDGVWYVGPTSTGVQAGIPQMRLGTGGIEYRYSDSGEWAMLITTAKLQEPATAIADELRTHPCKVSDSLTWLVWDATAKAYTDTGVCARGRSPIIRSGIWYVWDDETGDYASTGQSANSGFTLTKEGVEGVLTGDVTSHTHPAYEIPTLESVPDASTLTWTSDGQTYSFRIGQTVRVADASASSGYKFYRLTNLTDSSAVWEETGAGGVGKSVASVRGKGEIFNDYDNNQAIGKHTHAEGQQTYAEGQASHAEGYKTAIYAANAHAEGRNTTVVGAYAHAEGLYGFAYGSASHVEGAAVSLDWSGQTPVLTDAELIRAFPDSFCTYDEDSSVFNLNTEAIAAYTLHGAVGINSHAEGSSNLVLDSSGHVEGYGNIVGDIVEPMAGSSVQYAPHVEGYRNRTSSRLLGIHLGGAYCATNSGAYSFGHGYYLSLNNDYEVAFGQYNASEVDGKKVLFAYGIGTSDTDRRNAFSVLEDGSVLIPQLSSQSDQLNALTLKVEALEASNRNLQQSIADLTALVQNLMGRDKAYVLGRSVFLTEYMDAAVDGKTLTVSDAAATVSGDTLTID